MENIRGRWKSLRGSSRFHDVLVYLAFVVVAAVFWFVVAINDNSMHTFRMYLRLDNVPDSVTFIKDPPATVSVTVRDKGSSLLRRSLSRNLSLVFNFRDFAEGGVLTLSKGDIDGELKRVFGPEAQISTVSIDSLRLLYSTDAGKRVPVIVKVDVEAAPGYVIAGSPVAMERSVKIYSEGDEVDTVNHVYTQLLKKRKLSATALYEVKLLPIKNVKIVPSKIEVEIPVEPLVQKESYIRVETRNVPEGQSLLLFPDKVPVAYYVPMRYFNEDNPEISVSVDYNDTHRTGGNRLPLILGDEAPYVINPALKADSVEYTIVK